MHRVVIVAANRTPIGKVPGRYSEISDLDLMAKVFEGFLKKTEIEKKIIDGVYVGCCFPAERYNLARKALLRAGLPYDIPGVTINRTCCSSIEALVQGARQIATGDADAVLVGGVESMSSSKDSLKNLFKMVKASMKGTLPVLDDIKGDLTDEMGLATEKLALKFDITRREQDQYALESHKLAETAHKKGLFLKELLSIEENKGCENDIELKDDCIMEGLSYDMLAAEKPLFVKDGTITRFNSSPISDGAAAILLMSLEKCLSEGFSPLVELRCSDVLGVMPEDMGIGPVYVIKRLLKKQSLTLSDIDTIECNEAYAAQMLACGSLLNWNESRVNEWGGSIALGHPVGCTGLRICATLCNRMKQNNYQYGIAALCAGGGMGQGILFENMQS